MIATQGAPRDSIPEILELQRHRKILVPHRTDDRLQVIATLARDPDLRILDLRRHLEFVVPDESRDLFRNICRDTLLDLDGLPRVAQRRNIRIALLHIFHADVALGEFAQDNFAQRRDLELIRGTELDFIFLQGDLGFAVLEIKPVGEFLFGDVHCVLDLHRVHFADDIK